MQQNARAARTLESLSRSYDQQATDILDGSEGISVRDEVARHAASILQAREGLEQEDRLDRLLNAIAIRRPGVFSAIPDERLERRALALSLARTHVRSLQ